jgi:hypothetical protein
VLEEMSALDTVKNLDIYAGDYSKWAAPAMYMYMIKTL